MPQDKAGFINARQSKLESRKVLWQQLYQDIADNMIPVREDIRDSQQDGTRQGSDIYDGTGSFALNTLVKGLYGKMINPALNWFRIRFKETELNDIPEVREWTQATEKRLYSAFADSNFYDEMQTWIRDFAGFGTAALYMEEDIGEGKIAYMTVPTGQIYLDTDFWGKTDTLHRKIRKMEARQILSFFGDDTPESIKKAVKTDPFGYWEVVHAVYPREERDPSQRDSQNMPFQSVWLLRGKSGQGDLTQDTASASSTTKAEVIRESGFEDFPYIVAFWEKSGNEAYGRCPGMYALADVMGVNLMGKTLLELAEKAADPAYAVMTSMEGQPNFMPRGLNWITDPSEVPIPIQQGSGYPIGAAEVERKDEYIRMHFDVDAFLFFASQDRDLTATEVVAREGEKVTLLGPAIGKMSQALDQIIERALKIEMEAGRIAPPPDIVFQVESDFDIVYMGPLAQAQRALFQSSGINRGMEFLANLVQFDPNVLDIINWDKTAREQLEAAGFPETAIRDQQEVLARRLQRQQQEQAAREIENTEGVASAAKDFAKADKDTDGAMSEAIGEVAAQAGA